MTVENGLPPENPGSQIEFCEREGLDWRSPEGLTAYMGAVGIFMDKLAVYNDMTPGQIHAMEHIKRETVEEPVAA